MIKHPLVKAAVIMTAALSPLISSQAEASTAGAGTINTVIVNAAGIAFFNSTGARSGQPSCAIETTRWAFNATTPQGQAMLSLVMTAYATGKTVTVIGIGSCPDWSDTETVEHIQTIDP